jgi:hypothetical protein
MAMAGTKRHAAEAMMARRQTHTAAGKLATKNRAKVVDARARRP